MEKQKRWQLVLILAVIALTIYNILPTIFFYAKPLSEPIEQKQAAEVAVEIADRVNGVQAQTLEWLRGLVKHLDLTPKILELDKEDPSLIHIVFANEREAGFFRQVWPRSAAMMPFVPAQAELISASGAHGDEVWLACRLNATFDTKKLSSYFSYVPKFVDGKVSDAYKQLVFDRLTPLLLATAGESPSAIAVQVANKSKDSEEQAAIVLQLAKRLASVEKLFGGQSLMAKRYFASFAPDRVDAFLNSLEKVAAAQKSEVEKLEVVQEEHRTAQGFLDSDREQQIKRLQKDQESLKQAIILLEKQGALFASAEKPLTEQETQQLLENSFKEGQVQKVALKDLNPFFSELVIDWNHDRITLVLHSDLQLARAKGGEGEEQYHRVEQINQLLIDEVARLSRLSDERIVPGNNDFAFSLNQLTDSDALLALNLGSVQQEMADSVKERLVALWNPQNHDLQRELFPIMSEREFEASSPEEQAFGLVVVAPAVGKGVHSGAFRNSSLYLVGHGLQALFEQYRAQPELAASKEFFADFKALEHLMEQQGFFGYSATSYGFPNSYKKDYIFELPNYYATLIDATREAFTVHGDRRVATLEFTNLEQRLLTRNRIDDQIHDDLLKWRDLYQTAQVNLNLQARYDLPPPQQNVYWNNFLLSARKYFRGDDRKVLKWGLDLSGGKSVRLGLRDKSGRLISNPDDLNQAVNELYQRVNKLGVSDIGIRTQDQYIVLDFPGSQGLAATDLVQAASMTFNIFNEKYSPQNPSLSQSVNTFLQEVWNEAQVTNRTDPTSIHQIAWRHMGGSDNPNQEPIPQSEAAQQLYEQGLRLANTQMDPLSGVFDDTLSLVTRYRGEDFSQWQGQTHPLVIVFYHYALEGANLENIQEGYDPAKGNILSFSVRSSGLNSEGESINFRDQFYAWTSQFAQDKVVGTPKENYSRGNGWRMAVILNGNVISAPTLNAPLRDHAMITGHFTQREIHALASDLKAGALSFTPTILSEENISPELGQQERFHGILAAVVGTLAVIIIMVGYYRFAGVVASIAVLFNLLIMWGVLQNISAALTMPGIAGIILTIGMAVDANVLVFERIREEFAKTHRLPSAIQAGYRKAFSAIIDSNLTTIIAVLILMQFDSGPIKGFALTLIIGIVTSMFTALFMTRYFFAGWVQNPKHQKLSMAQFIRNPSFSFMNRTKITVAISAVVLALGAFAIFKAGENLVGMDFTGGFALTVDLEEKEGINFQEKASEAFIKAGAGPKDFQIRTLGSANHLRIQFSKIMQEEGHPFYALSLENDAQGKSYPFERNPRITWVVESLQAANLPLKSYQLPQLEEQWSVVSGQFSETMRNQAVIGLFLAMLAILVYITIRFEFKYAISAILGIIYDLIVTLALFACLHVLGLRVQIDLNVIAALMTIVGYSLNDTIIIFDRIREDVRLKRAGSFKELINHALNATLARTIMTSGTMLLVLLALLFLGGRAILEFSLVMSLGVIVGTLSSLFVAAPLLFFFHQKLEERRAKKREHGVGAKQ